MITQPQTRTRVDEIADGIYRINTPIDPPDGQGFSFNQYLLVDDEPLLFHSGPRQLFPAVSEAVASVMPVERLRYLGGSLEVKSKHGQGSQLEEGSCLCRFIPQILVDGQGLLEAACSQLLLPGLGLDQPLAVQYG